MGKIRSIIFLVIICFLLVPSIIDAQAQSQEVLVSGQVVDDTTNEPIGNATIYLYNYSNESSINWTFNRKEKTDENGQFSVKLSRGFQYRVYAYHFNSGLLDIDYAPAFIDISSNEDVSLAFRLVSAASIIFNGKVWFIDSTVPAEIISFTIIDNDDSVSSIGNYVKSYDALISNLLKLPLNQIIVPIERNITIMIKAIVSGKIYSKLVAVNDIGTLNLFKGGTFQLDVRKYSSQTNFQLFNDRFKFSEQLLDDLEHKGFYVVAERQDLAKSRNLLELAETRYISGLYDECYADLREAYIGVVTAIQRLNEIYTNASVSVSILTFFLAFTALVLSYILFNSQVSRGLASIPFFFLLFTLFYQTYPGTRLISPDSLLINAIISFGVSSLAALLLPLLLREKIVLTFSLAKHSLKRRKIRFILTLTSVIVLAMSFVSLTSFSTGYGLTIRSSYAFSPNPSGLLIKQPLSSQYISNTFGHFVPMNPLILDLIQEKPEILSVAPKLESIPLFDSFGSLSSSEMPTRRVSLYGILGVKPSAESTITGIEKTVVQGRYLMDGEENSILISVEAAEKLGVRVDEKVVVATIYGSRVELAVVGLFDDYQFSSVKDINGEELIPRKWVQSQGDRNPRLIPCASSEIFLASWETVLKTASDIVFLSRIDALVKNLELYLTLARQIALEQGLLVWYSAGRQNYEVVVGSYIETKGLAILIPWIIIILNVIITMLNSIYEQRKEISILSSIGLNPSHIVGLFIAEAAVIGVVGGGVGYLLGLGSYKLMSILSIVIEVRTKVSAAWSLISVSVSLAAVLAGALVAIRSSVVITPSMMRRWTVEGATNIGGPWTFQMPLRLREGELDSLFNYVTSRTCQQYNIVLGTNDVKWFEETKDEIKTRGIRFPYMPGLTSKDIVSFSLVASRGKNEDIYSLKMVCGAGNEDVVNKTASFLRMVLIEWSSS